MGLENLNTKTAVELSANNNNKLPVENKQASKLNCKENGKIHCDGDKIETTKHSTATTTNGCSRTVQTSDDTSGSCGGDSNCVDNVINNGQCKLRLVPIEKLMRRSFFEILKNSSQSEISDNLKKKTLPKRISRQNQSIIDISDSEDDSIIVIDSSLDKNSSHLTNTTTNSTIQKASVEEHSIFDTSLTKQIQTPKLKKCLVRIKRINRAATVFKNKQQTNSNNLNNKTKTTITNNLKMTESARCSSPANSDTSELIAAGNTKKQKHNTTSTEDTEESSEYDEIHMLSEDKDDGKKSGANSLHHSSDSEVIPAKKRRVFSKRKKNESDDDSDFEMPANKVAKPPGNKKRRRVRVKGGNSSSDNSGDDDDDDDDKVKNKRKHIRKIIKTSELEVSTKEATKAEEERRKRIEERQKLYNKIYDAPDSVEVSELVLDFDADSKESLLQVDKGLLKKLKPHQVTGVKFMWDTCFETLKDTIEKPGSGCILAHCMGLGKTLQVVALTHTLISNAKKTNVERALIITPLSTLTNWAREFTHWMSFARNKNIEIYDMSKYKDKAVRIFKLNEWYEEGGVCILGYDMYRILTNEKTKGLRKQQREDLKKSLVDPGPDMVVCDEGHLLKNEKTSISKAVNKIRTKRRIVLTGTPLQNNLKEYYCMIQFVKPNLLGTYKEYLNRFVNPISNGQYTDSTERDIRLMKHRSHILHKMLEGCIQRRDYSVLAPYLPPKHEYVVYTALTDLQQQLYEYYMNTQREVMGGDINGKGARLFQDFQDLRRIWTHPMNLRVNSDIVIKKRVMDDFLNDDEEEEEIVSSSSDEVSSCKSDGSASGTAVGVVKRRGTRQTQNADTNEASDDDVRAPQEDDPSEWWKRMVDEQELQNINHSPKLVILMKLLQRCETIGDKLLVFSQSLQSLDVIEHFLRMIDSKTRGNPIEGNVSDFKGTWTVGVDYFRLDGSCSVETRSAICKKFNDSKNLRARLFLISTRAGGLGINLVAANRVVIFDVSWNPSHDTQSIFRVYRFGQDKPCYIYRLIAMGTMEQKVYERQVAKQATAKRVIDEQQISRHYNQSDLQELYTYELKPSMQREVPVLPKDRLFAELLNEHETLIFKYHEHDSLLENAENENLSEAERKAAWAEYEQEKTRNVQTAQYMSYDRGAFGGNVSGSVTTSKIFGFRTDVLLLLLNMKASKDRPDLNDNEIKQLVPMYLQRLFDEMNVGDPTLYKELLQLHSTLAHPSGMYMNPLLYANQNPTAAGYFQHAPPGTAATSAGMVVMPQHPAAAASISNSSMLPHTSTAAAVPQPSTNRPLGFDPNSVYEID